MSNPSTKPIVNTNLTEDYIVNVAYNPSHHGYEVVVSRKINGNMYNVKTIITDYIYETVPSALTDVLNQAMIALNRAVKENMIKEFNNPSFRRKDYDREKQDV